MASDVHVELLCGGTPSFLVARALRDRLAQYDASVSIIRVDRDEELRGRQEGEHFVPFLWTDVAKLHLRRKAEDVPDSWTALQRFGKERIMSTLEKYPEANPPYNDVVGVQLAFELTWPEVSRHLEEDLDNASQQSSIWICPCVVFEGPTGTGVSWGLMDNLGPWIDNYRKRNERDPRFRARRNIQQALLEFIPERPTDGGNEENLLQGAVGRLRAHSKGASWPGHWLRFDGAKVKTGENAMADVIGATCLALFLTAEIAPPSAR